MTELGVGYRLAQSGSESDNTHAGATENAVKPAH
jgi:hypothetical protein